MKNTLSPKELAQAIGVSESSLKRWADDGLLAVSRTAGGHRRIPLAEAVRFIRSRGMPVVDPHVLGLPEVPAAQLQAARVDDGDGLYNTLHAGDLLGTRGVLLGTFLKGTSVAELSDALIRPALARLGELYQHGPEGIVIEHRAVGVAAQVLHELRTLLPAPAADAPLALGGAAEKDPYMLPTLLATLTLQEAGLQAMNLGPDVPQAALLAALNQHRPTLVWVSVSAVHDRMILGTQLAAASRAAREHGGQLIVGGRVISELGAWLEGVNVGRSMEELGRFARGLSAATPAQ